MQTTTRSSAYQRHIFEQMRTPMPHAELHTLMHIIQNRDILREVPLIFQGKVDAEMLQWAVDNATGALKQNNDDNILAWVDFLAKLDRRNSKIVCEYVAQESGYA